MRTRYFISLLIWWYTAVSEVGFCSLNQMTSKCIIHPIYTCISKITSLDDSALAQSVYFNTKEGLRFMMLSISEKGDTDSEKQNVMIHINGWHI